MSGYAGSQRPRQAILGQLPRIYRADGSPIRVLLVDDEPALTNLVKMALHYEGWDVDIAHNGREAIAKFDRVGPDVLVLDIMLPDVDGLRILERVRESDNYTPTLFLTARDSVMDRVTGLTAGADDYMTKPFSLEELVARLRGLLRRSTQLTPPAAEALKCRRSASRHRQPRGQPRRHADIAVLDRVRTASLPDAQSPPRAEPHRDPGPGLELRLRRAHQHRRPVHLLPEEEDRLRQRADDPYRPRHWIHAAATGMTRERNTASGDTPRWFPRSLRRQLLFGVLAVVTVVLVTVGVVSVLSLRGYVTAMNDAEVAKSLHAFNNSYDQIPQRRTHFGASRHSAGGAGTAGVHRTNPGKPHRRAAQRRRDRLGGLLRRRTTTRAGRRGPRHRGADRGPTPRHEPKDWAAWAPTGSTASSRDPTSWSSGYRSTSPTGSSPAKTSPPQRLSRPRWWSPRH